MSSQAAFPSPDESQNSAASFVIYMKMILVALFWGGTFIAGRVLAQNIPPLVAATARFAVASLLLVILCWKREGCLPRLTTRQLQTTFFFGLTGIFAYNLCFFSALALMPASRTALFVALNPVATALLLAALFGERLGWLRWLGIGLAFCGAIVVITRGDIIGTWHDVSRSIGWGEIVMMGAVLSWAAYTIIGRYALTTLSPLVATTYASLWGFLMLGIGAIFEIPDINWQAFTWQAWVSIFYLGAMGTVVAFVWYCEGIQEIGPSRAAVFNNLVPVFGVLLAAMILSEPVLISMIIGGTLTLCGVILTNKRRRMAP